MLSSSAGKVTVNGFEINWRDVDAVGATHTDVVIGMILEKQFTSFGTTAPRELIVGLQANAGNYR